MRLPPWGWWLAATAAVLVIGQAVIATRASFLMPLLQVLAGALPAFMFLALATASARSRGTLTGRRAAVGSLAWGALGGTTLAILAEMLLALAVAIAVSIWIGATRPDLLEQLQAWAGEMRQFDRAQVLSQATRLLTQPAVAVAALGFVGILVPLIEETAKGLAVPLVALTGRRLTSAEGFLLGVAAGAGFAVLEGILNGSLALTTPNAWGLLMALRVGATAMHCLATGLAGLGWQLILTHRRWGSGLALGLLAVALHASWNIATLGQTIIAVSGGAVPQSAGLLAMTGLVAFMALLGLLVIAALALIPRYLAARVTIVDGTASDAQASLPKTEGEV